MYLASSSAVCLSLLIREGKEFKKKKKSCPLLWPKFQRHTPELLIKSDIFFFPLPGTARMFYKKMSGAPA